MKKSRLFFILLTFALLALSCFCLSHFTVVAEKQGGEITCKILPQTITYGESVDISGRLTDLSTGEGLQRMINLTYSEDNGTTWMQLREKSGELAEQGDAIWTNETGYYGPYAWKPEHIPHAFLVKASFGGDEMYEQAESSIQRLTVELPPSLPIQVLNHRSYEWYSTTLWITGEVQNVGTTNLERVKLTVVYYNSAGSIIGVDRFHIRSRLITLGQKSPFIAFAGISHFSPINASLIASYEVVVRGYELTTEPYIYLQIVDQADGLDEWGNYHVTGEIENNGTVLVESVAVVSTFYDSDDEVVDAWFDFAYPSSLHPNETAEFDIELDKDRLNAIGLIDHYVLQVDYYIARNSSTIACSVSSLEITIGGAIKISGSISPALGEVNVTLTFTKPDETSFTATVMTTPEGLFTYSFMPEDAGMWSVSASWLGDINYEGASSSLASFAIQPLVREIPPPETAVVAATAGVAISAGFAALMSFSGLGHAFNSLIARLGLPDWLAGFLQLYTEDVFETVDETELQAVEEAPLLTRREIAAIAITALVVAIVYGYVEAHGLPRFLYPSVFVAVIPLALLTAGLVMITEEVFEALISRVYGIQVQVQLWLYGLIAFIVSGLFFMVPFSTPCICQYQGGEISKRISGLIVVSKMLLLLTLLIPFSVFALLGFRMIGDTGMLISLMIISYSLMPLRPLEGKELFDYDRKVWLAIFAPALILFFAWVLGLLPGTVFLAVGFVAALLWFVTFYRTRPNVAGTRA